MKKAVLGFAALVSVTGAAWAQSSVTAFGVVDLAVRSLKGADTLKLLNNEGRAASRLGFRGMEDLGGGLKAGFWLESGLTPDDGAAGSPFWGRRATVNLTGSFGELRLGRHKHASRMVVDDFDIFGTSGMLDATRIFSGLGSGYVNRADNQVAYALPGGMGGVYGTFDVAAGEGADANKTTSFRLGYKDKGLHLAFGYGQHGAGNKLKTKTVGMSYSFGSVALTSMISQNDRGSLDQRVVHIGGSMALGPGKLSVGYSRATGANSSLEANMMGVGYDYSFSKRTSVYTTVGRINNDGNATTGASFSLNGAKGAALPIKGGNSTGYEVGIRHNF